MKITKAIWDALPASALKDAFKATANADEYDNGEEDAASLKRALESEKEDRRKVGEKLATYEAGETKRIEDARKKALEEARSSGDFKAVEDDYKRQLKDLADKVKQQESQREQDIANLAVEKEAGELAKLFVTPAFALPVIKARLKADIVDGVALVRVLDATGKATASSISDLKNEFLTNAEYKASLAAPKGGGGGSTQLPGGGGATPTSKKSFKTATEESQFAISNPEAYAALPAGD